MIRARRPFPLALAASFALLGLAWTSTSHAPATTRSRRQERPRVMRRATPERATRTRPELPPGRERRRQAQAAPRQAEALQVQVAPRQAEALPARVGPGRRGSEIRRIR